MRVHEAIGAATSILGVRHVFGLMGRANMSFLLDLIHQRGVDYIAARHETSALVMADAYARRTGRLGVATITVGPAVSNALTGVLEATRGGTPMLVLAGDSAAGHGDYGQFLGQERLFEAVGVAHHRLADPPHAAGAVRIAASRALRERRPVVLSVPLDVQGLDAHAPDPTEGPLAPTVGGAADPVAVHHAADAVVRSRRPVIVAGRGALGEGTAGELRALGARVGAFLTTTLHADGLFESDPYSLGVVGVHSFDRSVALLAEADLILAFGASLDRFNTRAGHLYPAVREIVHCDDDPAARVSAPVTMSLVGDARLTAAALSAELARRGYRATGYRDEHPADTASGGTRHRTPSEDARDAGDAQNAGDVRDAQNARDAGDAGDAGESPDHTGSGDFIDPRALLTTLDRWLPPRRAVVQESGHASGDAVAFLPVGAPRARVSTIDFEAIGVGLAAAVGTAVGRPDEITVAVVGDGGVLMALGELETMVRYRLPILLLVLNNSAYGAEVRELEMRGLPAEDALFPTTDFARVGAALGARSATVRRLADLKPVQDWITGPDGPFVLDCRLDPHIGAGWFHAAIGSPDGFLRQPRPGWGPR